MFQVTAQKHTDPTIAALLMSLESVFGALAGVIVLGETFTFKEILGSICVFASVILAQLKPNSVIILKTRRKNKDGRFTEFPETPEGSSENSPYEHLKK